MAIVLFQQVLYKIKNVIKRVISQSQCFITLWNKPKCTVFLCQIQIFRLIAINVTWVTLHQERWKAYPVPIYHIALCQKWYLWEYIWLINWYMQDKIDKNFSKPGMWRWAISPCGWGTHAHMSQAPCWAELLQDSHLAWIHTGVSCSGLLWATQGAAQRLTLIV